jgi:hypothetical protein
MKVLIRPAMTEMEQAIFFALVELDVAVKSMAASNLRPSLIPLFARFDERPRQLPRDARPSLLNCLHKKCYESARLRLEDWHAENQVGNRRHVN